MYDLYQPSPFSNAALSEILTEYVDSKLFEGKFKKQNEFCGLPFWTNFPPAKIKQNIWRWNYDEVTQTLAISDICDLEAFKW